MLPEIIQPSNYLMRMPDGTVKQMNPFTGTEVWTVPGRGHRPLGNHADCRPEDRPRRARRALRLLRRATAGDAAGEGAPDPRRRPLGDAEEPAGRAAVRDGRPSSAASPTCSRSSPGTTGSATSATRCRSRSPPASSPTSRPRPAAATSST